MSAVDQDAEWLGLTPWWASHDFDQDAGFVELARWDVIEVLRRDAGPLGKPACQPSRVQPLGRARASVDQRSGRVDVPVQLGLWFGDPERIHLAGSQKWRADVAAGEALGAHRSEAWQDDVGDDGTHGHGPSGCQTGPVGPSPATPVAKASGWVFGINQALAALNAALGRLRRRPEVAPQPGTLPAGARAGKLVGPGWHEQPETSVATDVHVRPSVRDRTR